MSSGEVGESPWEFHRGRQRSRTRRENLARLQSEHAADGLAWEYERREKRSKSQREKLNKILQRRVT